MASALQIINALCSGLYNDANRDIFIELATNRTDECFYGDDYNLAIALRACHMWTLSNRGSGDQAGAAGNVKEGDLSIGYSAGTKKENKDLDQTHYGRQLQGLQRGKLPGASVTGSKGFLSTCTEEIPSILNIGDFYG